MTQKRRQTDEGPRATLGGTSDVQRRKPNTEQAQGGHMWGRRRAACSHLLHSPPPSPAPSACLTQSLSAEDIQRELGRLHSSKAAGPDGVSPRVLRCCASQFSGVLHRIFNMSPSLWKTSCLVPVPKKMNPSTPSDYRPVALTSHVVKTLERLILRHLRLLVEPWLDPLQFAYQPYRCGGCHHLPAGPGLFSPGHCWEHWEKCRWTLHW